MADITDTLKELLGDNADEKISSIMNMLGSSLKSSESESPSENTISDSELISQAQGIISRLSQSANDDRSNLLMSLKPFMREGRKESIDKAVKMLNPAQLSQLFKEGM